MTLRFPLASIFLLGIAGISLIFWYREIRVSDVQNTFSGRVALADDEDDDDDDDDEEDDEDDKEEDDDEDDDDSDTSRSARPKETVITTYRLVERTVTLLDEKFRVDTDGDLLVDGLDPHPDTPESAYFTDDDEDAVPNALDAYPGEDDFLVFGDEEDQDKDGILDSFVAASSKEIW